MTPDPARKKGRPRGRPFSWSLVVGLLVVTCLAMLAAIYWVVRTGKV